MGKTQSTYKKQQSKFVEAVLEKVIEKYDGESLCTEEIRQIFIKKEYEDYDLPEGVRWSRVVPTSRLIGLILGKLGQTSDVKYDSYSQRAKLFWEFDASKLETIIGAV